MNVIILKRGGTMIRISEDKLWKLIYHDPKITSELNEILLESREKREHCYQKYLKQKTKGKILQQEMEKCEKKLRDLEERVNHVHAKISSYEIRKIFLEQHIKKLKRLFVNPNLSQEKRKKIGKDLEKTLEKIEHITSKQQECRDEITTYHRDKKEIKKEISVKKIEIKENEKQISLELNNTTEWDVTMDEQRTFFYQKTYDKLHQNYFLLQEVMIRDREQDKKETFREAKEITKEILIGEEEISLDPPGYTRRLTKEEREKYRSIH